MTRNSWSSKAVLNPLASWISRRIRSPTRQQRKSEAGVHGCGHLVLSLHNQVGAGLQPDFRAFTGLGRAWSYDLGSFATPVELWGGGSTPNP